MDKTGYDATGFRPYGNQIAIILTDDDLEIFNSKNSKAAQAKEKKPSPIIGANGTPKIIKGEALEEEERLAEIERKKENRTFTVASVSKSIAEMDNAPLVGDEISLMAGNLVEVKIGDNYYGIIPIHRVLGEHKDPIRL